MKVELRRLEGARYDEGMGEEFLPLTQRVVFGDMPCAKCKYNLRGQPFLNKCPECGELVAATYFGRGGRRRVIAVRAAAGAAIIAFVLFWRFAFGLATAARA